MITIQFSRTIPCPPPPLPPQVPFRGATSAPNSPIMRSRDAHHSGSHAFGFPLRLPRRVVRIFFMGWLVW